MIVLDIRIYTYKYLHIQGAYSVICRDIRVQGSLEGARRVFTMACLVEAQHTPHTRRRHAHARTHKHTHTGTACAESC